MRKHMLKAISALCVSALLLPCFANTADTVRAAEVEAEPVAIFSTIEGAEVEIEIADAISSDVARAWYCNDEVFTLDETHVDTSEGTTAKLKITEASTSDHMKKFKCVSGGDATETSFAQLYVISKDNYENAQLIVKDFDAVTGSELYAKNVTLYIDQTPYPNFAPLQFVEDGVNVDKVKVKNGEHTYTLVDTVFGREIQAVINGVGDSVPPTIKYLGVKDGLASRFAAEKTVEVVAVDDVGLPEDAYYFEKDEQLASAVKVFLLDGATSDDLKGINWTKDNQFKVTDNGTYTVFVRDLAGNIAYKDIVVSKISTSAPYIMEVSLSKEDGKAILNVKAKDADNQPLFYRLNGGAWQDNSKLYGAKEGDNKIEVKNEAGVIATATKTVYLSLFLGNEEGFTEEALYNYIKISPSSWTNKSVTVSLVLPDSLAAKLASAPYSINGSSFSTSRTRTVSENGETVQFQVRDIYGNTHSSKVVTISNIDKEKPSIEVTSNEGTFTVKTMDSGSGIAKITVSSTTAKDFVIKSNTSDKVKEDSATYKAPANGTYQFAVTDFAGNTTSVSGQMKFYTNENGSGSAVRNSNSGSKSTKSSGSTTSTAKSTEKTTTKTTSKSTSSTVAGAKKDSTTTKKTTSTAKSSSEKDDSKQAKVTKEVATRSSAKKESAKTEQRISVDRMAVSNAGQSETRELSDVELIDVKKEQDQALASAPILLESHELDNSRAILLKRLVLFIIGLSAVLFGIVIWVNTGRKVTRDDFSFKKKQ